MPTDTARTGGNQARAMLALPDRFWHVVRDVVLALVHSAVWMSVGAASLAVTTMYLLDRPLDPLPPVLVFGATMVVYGVDRLTDLALDEQNLPGRAAFVRRYGVPLLASGVVLYLLATGLAVARGVAMAEFLWVPPVAGVVYSLRGVQRRLLVKNVLVGLGWAAVPAGVGVYYGVPWTADLLAITIVTAVLLTIAAMVFDVKDVTGDRAVGVRTVPTEYGVRTTRRLALVGCGLVATGVVGLVWLGVLHRELLVLVAFAGYVATYSVSATPDRSPLFYGFVVDGEHVFLAALTLVLT